MYFDLSVGSKKSYLQWFPFSRITEDEAQYISSEEFFEKYIKKLHLCCFRKQCINQKIFFKRETEALEILASYLPFCT